MHSIGEIDENRSLPLVLVDLYEPHIWTRISRDLALLRTISVQIARVAVRRVTSTNYVQPFCCSQLAV